MSASRVHVVLTCTEIKPPLSDYWIMRNFSAPEFKERCGAGLRPVREPAGERAGCRARQEDRYPGQDASQPDHLPAPGRPARHEHEYKPNGTQCLFAAVKGHEGYVLSNATEDTQPL